MSDEAKTMSQERLKEARYTAVDEFQRYVLQYGKEPIEDEDVWRVAKYKASTEFYIWRAANQERRYLPGEGTDTRFVDVLKMSADTFLRLRESDGSQITNPD